MLRRIIISIGLLLLIIGGALAITYLAPPGLKPALAGVLFLFLVGAIVYFNYWVVKPLLIEWAKRRAQEYCEAGNITDPKIYDMICGRLSRAHNDAEADELQRKLRELKEKSGKPKAE